MEGKPGVMLKKPLKGLFQCNSQSVENSGKMHSGLGPRRSPESRECVIFTKLQPVAGVEGWMGDEEMEYHMDHSVKEK